MNLWKQAGLQFLDQLATGASALVVFCLIIGFTAWLTDQRIVIDFKPRTALPTCVPPLRDDKVPAGEKVLVPLGMELR